MIHESTSDLQIRTVTDIIVSSGFESVKRESIDRLLKLLELESNDLSEYLSKYIHLCLYYSIDFNNTKRIQTAAKEYWKGE